MRFKHRASYSFGLKRDKNKELKNERGYVFPPLFCFRKEKVHTCEMKPFLFSLFYILSQVEPKFAFYCALSCFLHFSVEEYATQGKGALPPSFEMHHTASTPGTFGDKCAVAKGPRDSETWDGFIG